MSFIKSYFAPTKAAAAKKQEVKPKAVVSEKPQMSEKTGLETPNTRYPSAIGTPGGNSPWASRPASIYPAGDFRNNDRDDLRDIKCDVMVNWLYQQQMEMLWTAGGQDEGVVLKKTRGQYTCCPADIMEEPYGFFKAVEMLNVRVRDFPKSTMPHSTSY